MIVNFSTGSRLRRKETDLSIKIVKRPQYSYTEVFFGWGKRIRTFGMAESESAALPLGYTPIV